MAGGNSRIMNRDSRVQTLVIFLAPVMVAISSLLYCIPAAYGDFRCLDKGRCGISSDSSLKVCTSDLDCRCAINQTEVSCTGSKCNTNLCCGNNQVLKSVSCTGAQWKNTTEPACYDCSAERKSSSDQLTEMIACCGTPSSPSKNSPPGTSGGSASGTGGTSGSGQGIGRGVVALASDPGCPVGSQCGFLESTSSFVQFVQFIANEASSSTLFFNYLSGIPPYPPSPAFSISTKDHPVLSAAEVDLGSVIYKGKSPSTLIDINSNDAKPVQLGALIPTKVKGVTVSGYNGGVLNKGQSTTITLTFDTSASGIKSGSYSLQFKSVGATSYKNIVFTASGLVWPSPQEIKDNHGKPSQCAPRPSSSPIASSTPRATPTVSGGPDSCSPPVKIVNPNFPKLGSESLALAKAATQAQFESLLSKVTLSDAELALKSALPTNDMGARLLKLVMASNRLLTSQGAVNSVNAWGGDLLKARTTTLRASKAGMTDAQIQQSVSQEILITINPILNSAQNDDYGEARSQLVLALSNVRELLIVTRIVTSILLDRGVDTVWYVNPLGRFNLRNALVRSYLSTNPPLNEANTVLAPVLQKLSDPIAKAPLGQLIYSQYPELWVALKGN